ncbi:MAG TPA: hypothetical protein DCL63_05385 [Firmicutes bacterium]|jgi:vacuolar-type H+-ATPase subunit H|nr:hypothetical protein [Bacillota bacterium]HBK59666.1 hypothetical protein [Bacillota bacterium]
MSEVIGERIAQLKQEIEALRDELRQAVLREASAPEHESTHTISDRLDRLIVEFMKVKDEVGEAGRD